eukprot:CAMPEP_0113690130 /NCGR_PEP_ID=MMETSP0038_2-20120614/17594_1 /TAXON_ID=2898 /ORGANISM="Cryptomonas paramecium" /LENGTH=264 /DNA_ID=CAMNT_0000611369 /DNA_START=6 /DNA_END=800 /DNA_ORIENTATION=- /assembly_acc=CAM_ASM_000170
MSPKSSASAEAIRVCTAQLFESGTVTSSCVTLALSKFLGTLVILGGVAFKVPQILKIAKNKSAEGIALSQYALELLISANTLSFNYHINAPFSTYGESVFILLQNIVIVFQIGYYQKISVVSFVLSWVVYLGIVAFLYSEFSRDLKLDAPVCTFTDGFSCQMSRARLQDILQVISTLFVIVSRVPQIMTNFRTRNVANLALVTWLLNFLGASIRVFTTMREIPDQHILIFAFFVSALLSGTVVVQIIAFGGSKKDKAAAKDKTH